MQVEVVVNCGAGSVDGDEVEAERQRVADAFAPLGMEPRTAVVTGAALDSAVRAAAERGAEVVAVAGGDGSLGTAAAAVSDVGATLGVLPLGTFNHFARDLGIPLDVGEAARCIVEGETASVDLAEVNGRCFVNNSSIGLYPVMVDLRDEIRSSRGWGKARAVPVASWRVLRRFPTRRLRIDAGGETWQLRSPFVFVGNNRYEVGPRGIGARSRMAEGTLCGYIAEADSRLAMAGIALRAVLRGATATPRLDATCAPQITVDAHGHTLLVAVDGEVEALRAPLRYRIRPGALRVRVPEGALPLDVPPPGDEVEAGVDPDADTD